MLTRMYRSGLQPCPYLPGLAANIIFFEPRHCSPVAYSTLLAGNFRRSGSIIYRPDCQGCAGCRQLRVDVTGFSPSKSQSRSQRKNADVQVKIADSPDDPAAFELYRRFVTERHGQARPDLAEVQSFLGTGAVPSFLMKYLVDDKLVGAGWVDRAYDGLSSVYFAFDPDQAWRSLGVYSVLAEIELAKSMNLAWLYLGYWVKGSPSMEYKNQYNPHQILIDGRWHDGQDLPAAE